MSVCNSLRFECSFFLLNYSLTLKKKFLELFEYNDSYLTL